MFTQTTPPRRATHIAALGLILTLLAAALVVPAHAAPPAPAAVGDSVTWAANPTIITNAVVRANFPRVAIDSNGKTHIVYITQLPGGSSAPWEIRYTNNVSGSFSNPGQLIDTIAGNPSIPSALIIAGPNNVLHRAYFLTKIDDKLYYQQSTNSGATWSTPEAISTGGKSSEPGMAVDPNGNIYFVWLSTLCGQPNVFYRTRAAGGALSPVTQPKSNCSVFQNRPTITYSGGKPHVIFAENGEIRYARLEGSAWVNSNISNTGSTSLNPALASDGGNNLFVAWDENINSRHDIWFKASFDGGANWTAPNPLTDNIGISTYPYIAWSTATERAYIVWQDQNTVVGGADDIWEREFNPVTQVTSDAFQASKTGGRSKNPGIALEAGHADLTWHDNTTGPDQIYDLAGTTKPINTGCTGTIALEASPTKNNPISGTITPSCPAGGSPDKMQISVDAPITDVNTPAQQTYSSSVSIPIPASGCSHIVYVRLFQNNVAGTPFASTPIVVDNSVDADVRMLNPNMDGLPTVYNKVVPAGNDSNSGARDGDPEYTRDLFFFLGIDKGSECSGLARFSVTNIISGTIPENGYANSVALPGSTFPGPRAITVAVTDTLSNKRDYVSTMTYDPPDTDPSENVTNTLGLPVLDMSQPPSVAGPAAPANYIVVRLSFSKIHVSDNLYGDGAGPGTSDFWGVWVANSATDVPTDSATLQWYPVEVAAPGPSFTIDWNLFNGLTAQDQRAGPYFVYVRFLDGAGNPSTGTIKTQVTLAANYSVAKDYLPIVTR